jgi:hypothetical protein
MKITITTPQKKEKKRDKEKERERRKQEENKKKKKKKEKKKEKKQENEKEKKKEYRQVSPDNMPPSQCPTRLIPAPHLLTQPLPPRAYKLYQNMPPVPRSLPLLFSLLLARPLRAAMGLLPCALSPSL